MIPAIDISQYQGTWIDRGEAIDLIKIGGGDAGIYFDSQATNNYNQAKAHGKGVGGYWFIGWVMGSAQEASAFLRGMSPLAENDVYALDIENGTIPIPSNVIQYVTDMVDYIHTKIGLYPLLYMNLSTLNSYNWDTLLANCGLWLADWAVSPTVTIPVNHVYVMQQYSDGPNYDHDEWFGTLAEFNAYGYHTPTTIVSTPQPVIVPTTVVEAATTTQNTPPTQTVEAPVTSPPVTESTSTISLSNVATAEAGLITTPVDVSKSTAPTVGTVRSLPSENFSFSTSKTNMSWWNKVIDAILRFLDIRI